MTKTATNCYYGSALQRAAVVAAVFQCLLRSFSFHEEAVGPVGRSGRSLFLLLCLVWPEASHRCRQHQAISTQCVCVCDFNIHILCESSPIWELP